MSLGAILLFLIVLGGLIAYAGDVIGRRVGRRHLRLFGLRPRTTGLIVAVLSGMLVALIVFAALMLFVRGARETLLEAERVRAERDQLLAERERLSEQVENLKAQAARAFAEEEKLRLRVKTLSERLLASERRLEALEEERKRLEEDLSRARAELAEKTAELERIRAEAEAAKAELERLKEVEAELKAEIQSLKAARDEAEARAERAAGALAELKATQEKLTAEVFELERRYRTLQGDLAELNALRSELERQNADLRAQNEALTRLLSEAQLEAARLKGQVSELAEKSERAIEGLAGVVAGEVLAEVYLGRGEDPRVRLAQAERQAKSRAKIMGLPELAPISADPRNWRGPGLILVVARGVGPDGRLRAEARFVPQKELFAPGEVIAKTRLSPDPAEALTQLIELRKKAEERLLALGVPPHRVEAGRIPDRELGRFIEEHRGEAVEVAVVAERRITTTGEVSLALKVLR